MAKGKPKAKPKTRGNTRPRVDEKGLSNGEICKSNALRKSLGDRIAEEAFAKWKAQKADGPAADPTAERVAAALDPIVQELRFPRGSHCLIRLGRGRFVAERAHN